MRTYLSYLSPFLIMNQKIRKSLQKSHWLMRKTTSSMRFLPGFIIFGVARGGTTSLYNYLTSHPNIAPSMTKEVMFFDAKFHQGFRWYQAHFPSQFSPFGKKKLIAGEASPSYFHHPLVPNRIKAALPQVKLIVLLRNPVDRAYSHYSYAVKAGREPLPFEIAVKLQMAERACFEQEQVFAAEDKYHQRIYHPHAYLSKGIYVEHLKRWFECFSQQPGTQAQPNEPPKQILVLQSETLYQEPAKVLQQTLEFLEMPQWSPTNYQQYNQAGHHFALSATRTKSVSIKPEPMAPSIRQELIEYFKPYNEKLYEFLGTDFGWEE